ncbi:MAG: hypothetical protein ACRDE5_19075, partial [Ginsengibacter sp.]
MNIKQQLQIDLKKAIKELGLPDVDPQIDYPTDPKHGDYSSNIA